MILHGCHHRVGTKLFTNLFRTIAEKYNLKFKVDILDDDTDIFLEEHSNFDFNKILSYTGSHMVRDPRDILISSYFYHLTTDESWAHEPKKRFNGLTYQQHIDSLGVEDGILAEIRRSYAAIQRMTDWNFNNPNFIEIKYEILNKNRHRWFSKIFKHYRFNKEMIKYSLNVVDKLMEKSPDHL